MFHAIRISIASSALLLGDPWQAPPSAHSLTSLPSSVGVSIVHGDRGRLFNGNSPSVFTLNVPLQTRHSKVSRWLMLKAMMSIEVLSGSLVPPDNGSRRVWLPFPSACRYHSFHRNAPRVQCPHRPQRFSSISTVPSVQPASQPSGAAKGQCSVNVLIVPALAATGKSMRSMHCWLLADG